MRPGRSTPEPTGAPSGYTIGISAGQRYRTSSPVTARPMIIRWISDVPSTMVKILAGMGRVIGILVRPPIGPCGWGYRCPFDVTRRLPAAQDHCPLSMLAAFRQPTVSWVHDDEPGAYRPAPGGGPAGD